jgi:hypothetical protein
MQSFHPRHREPQPFSPALRKALAEIDRRVAHGIHAAHKRLARGHLRQDPRVIFLSPRAMRIVARWQRRAARPAASMAA